MCKAPYVSIHLVLQTLQHPCRRELAHPRVERHVQELKRALRRLLLEGWTLAQVLPDLEMLLLFDAVLVTIAALAFSAALRHARRAGTLAQY